MTRGRQHESRKAELNDLLGTVDVEELFAEFGIDYRRTAGGTDLQLRVCPQCRDDRWRTYFSLEKRRGICFHADCGTRFNLFSFTRAQLEADNRGTIRFFDDYAHRTLGRRLRATPVVASVLPADRSWELPPSVELPTPEGMTHPYLLERNVLPHTQARFGLRWCERGAFTFEDALGAGRTMDFSQRVILPIRDLDGSLGSFVGRDATGTAEIRYLFPPSHRAAARFLYGADLACGAEHVVVGEGPFDAIAIHQALDHPDFRRVAAIGSFGLSIGHGDSAGDDQLGRLRKLHTAGMTRLTLLWDGERNALKEAMKAAEMVNRAIAGLAVHVGLLPQGVDPAEVESRVVRDAITRAEPFSLAMKARLTLSSPYQSALNTLAGHVKISA
jgi:DNA primase